MLQQRFRNAGEATHGATWHGDGPWQLLFRHVSSRVALSIFGDRRRRSFRCGRVLTVACRLLSPERFWATMVVSSVAVVR